MRMSGND